MPIRIQSDLPAKEILEKENIFVMDENRALHQDIRPVEIGILNLMPLKEETELQLLRALSNTPLQVDVTFVTVSTHESKNTSMSHLNKFYETFSDVKRRYFDGLIITGAPVEQMEYEEVDYWQEICQVFEWTKSHVTLPSPRKRAYFLRSRTREDGFSLWGTRSMTAIRLTRNISGTRIRDCRSSFR